MRPDQPVLILAEKVEGEDYLETLKHILKEVYRIKVGGLPRPKVVKMDKQEVEEAEAEKHVYVIDDTEAEFFEFFSTKPEVFGKKANVKKFLERIGELFSQYFGFLVIYAEKERLDYVQLILASVEEQIPKWCKVRTKKLESDWKSKVASSVWGFIEPKGITGMTLDKCFLKCENLFWRKLEGLVRTPKYAWVKESVESEEGIEGYESSLHYLLKVCIARYFAEKNTLVETEVKLKEGVIADVFIPNKNLAIEIETLYGTSITLWRNLRRTIEKYEGTEHEVWIVIPNLQLSLYLEGIWHERDRLNKEGRLVEFYALNVRNGDLVNLSEYIKMFGRGIEIKGLKKANI